MNIKKRLSHGFFYIFSGRVGAGILTVLTTPIVVRVLGSGGYGDYAFAMAVYSALRTVAGGGVYEGARKYIAEYREPAKKADVFNFYLGISSLFGMLSALSLLVFTHVGVGTLLLEPRLQEYLYLVAALVFAHAFYHLVRSSLMGYKLEEFSETMYVLNRVFFPIIGIPLALVGLHVSGILIGHVLSTVLIVLIGYVALVRHTAVRIPSARAFVPDIPGVFQSRMFRYGLLNVVFVLITKSLYVTDILLLQPFEGSGPVGYYNASLVVAEFLWFIPLTIQIVLLHSTSQLWAENRVDEITTVASAITRYTLLLTGGIAVILAVIGDSFLPIYYGDEFIASYVPMLLLLPGVIGFALARPIYAIGQAHGNMRPLLYGTGTAALLNLLLNLVLIPQYGVNGAAVATSLGYGSMLILHIWAARMLGFDPLQNVQIGRITVACLVVVPVVYYVDQVIHSAVITLVVVPLLGISILFLVSRALGIITGEETNEALEAVSQSLP